MRQSKACRARHGCGVLSGISPLVKQKANVWTDRGRNEVPPAAGLSHLSDVSMARLSPPEPQKHGELICLGAEEFRRRARGRCIPLFRLTLFLHPQPATATSDLAHLTSQTLAMEPPEPSQSSHPASWEVTREEHSYAKEKGVREEKRAFPLALA